MLNVPTSPAHVFPEGLGGRRATKDTVCNDCNNSFSKIEGVACTRVAAVGALAGALRGDRKPVTAIIEHQGTRFRTANARMDALAKPPRENGRIVPFPAARDDQVRVIAKALRDRGLPAEAMLDGRFYQEADDDIPEVPPLQEVPVDLGFLWADKTTKRVMVKIAVELIASFDILLGARPELERARQFARWDKGNAWDFPAGYDTDTEGAQLPSIFAPLVHGIDAWSAGGKVHYRMTLFTEFRIVGSLTEAWSGSPFSMAYFFDVRNPADRCESYEQRDGSVLVNKSRRTRIRELRAAEQRFEDTSFRISERRQGRAPPPDLAELYPDVKSHMLKM